MVGSWDSIDNNFMGRWIISHYYSFAAEIKWIDLAKFKISMDPVFDTKPIPNGSWDVIVIGAGAAGLMTCLELPSHLKVLLVNRNTSKRSASRWAQGGIAAVVRSEDSFDLHAEDTFKAGCGLCDFDSVKILVEQAPECVDRLQKLGMEFD